MVSLALDVMPSSSVTSATLRVTDTAPVLVQAQARLEASCPRLALAPTGPIPSLLAAKVR